MFKYLTEILTHLILTPIHFDRYFTLQIRKLKYKKIKPSQRYIKPGDWCKVHAPHHCTLCFP